MSVKSFKLLDGTMTMHGVRFQMSAGRLERFTANPVMLYMHIRGKVIGMWANVRLDGDSLVADPVFDDEDPEVKEIARKVGKGFLKACSVGVVIYAVELVDNIATVTDWEVYEGSIVDVGSNANALVLYSPDGEMISDTENHVKNLTLSLTMAEEKKIAGTVVAVPKEIALAAGLAEDATSDSIVTKIKEVADNYVKTLEENKNLKLTAATQKATEIKELLDSAVSEKRISATERPHYEHLAALNLDAVKAILAKTKAPADLVDFAGAGKQPETDSDELFDEYEKLDKTGKLAKLQATNPEKFKALYKARWNKEFN